MQGILPLVEAFLAFGLTMLTLSLAVSAIMSIIQRSFGWRARRLRETVEYVFRNEVCPRLDDLRTGDGSGHKALEWWLEKPSEAQRLRRFIIDMTFLPKPVPPKAEATAGDGGPDRDERDDEFGDPRHKRDRYLESLPAEEFVTRLRASRLGRALARHPDGEAVEALFKATDEAYETYAQASSEGFARPMRMGSLVLGFTLAVVANVDTFNLLETYLTNPGVRAEVIARREATLEAVGDPERLWADVEAKQSRIIEELEAAGAAAEDLGQRVSDAELGERVKALIGRLDEVERTIEAVGDQISKAGEQVGKAARAADEARGVVAGLTGSFPIGWDRYPNCYARNADPRCVPVSDVPGWTGAQVWNVASNDTAGFAKWLIGVLLTGALVGLGTPFWVETTKNFMRLRGWLNESRPAKARKT